jgi:hypothetical protein
MSAGHESGTRLKIKRAARVGPEAARETAHDNPNHTSPAATPQCGKQAAFGAYNNGWLTLDATVGLFRINPAWRSA